MVLRHQKFIKKRLNFIKFDAFFTKNTYFFDFFDIFNKNFLSFYISLFNATITTKTQNKKDGLKTASFYSSTSVSIYITVSFSLHFASIVSSLLGLLYSTSYLIA